MHFSGGFWGRGDFGPGVAPGGTLGTLGCCAASEAANNDTSTSPAFIATPNLSETQPYSECASLVENHERQRKQAQDLIGTCRAREAAGAAAVGAAMGSFGLIAFACCASWWLPSHQPILVIAAATAAWAVIAAMGVEAQCLCPVTEYRDSCEMN